MRMICGKGEPGVEKKGGGGMDGESGDEGLRK